MSNIKPAGYINKLTGNIWRSEQQPGAEDEPETYEPLVRLSDVHGLVAENAAMREAINGVLTHCPINDPDIDKACAAMICNDALQSTPATDAAIAEIKAQGVDEFSAHKRDIAAGYKRNGCEESWVDDAEDCALGADLFAANLRAGRKG